MNSHDAMRIMTIHTRYSLNIVLNLALCYQKPIEDSMCYKHTQLRTYISLHCKCIVNKKYIHT